jgi:hypothetical protein
MIETPLIEMILNSISILFLKSFWCQNDNNTLWGGGVVLVIGFNRLQFIFPGFFLPNYSFFLNLKSIPIQDPDLNSQPVLRLTFF